jgi:membrane protease YdiL (CAAX protease family)
MGKEIRRFIIYTFSFSWLFWGIAILLTQTHTASFRDPLILVPYMLGGLSPAICEIFLKKKYAERGEYRKFLGNIINPRHHLLWYIMIIFSAGTICFLPTLFYEEVKILPLYIALIEMPFMIIGGGLEEIGWRGFLQPALQHTIPAFPSTLIVSSIWTIWHLPLWFILGTNQAKMNFITFFITAMALSLILAAVYNSTGSIFLCILMHAFINSFWDVFGMHNKIISTIPGLIFCLIVFVITEILRHKTVTMPKAIGKSVRFFGSKKVL